MNLPHRTGWAIALVLAFGAPSAAAAEPAADSLYCLAATWTSDTGAALKLRHWEGRPVVLTLFYTSCKHACPIMVEDLKRIQSRLTAAERSDVAFVTVTLDPATDTPARLAAFKAKLPAAQSWTFLHGNADAVRELAAALAIRYRRVGDDIMHTNAVTVLDRAGRVVHQTLGLQSPPKQTLDALRKVPAAP